MGKKIEFLGAKVIALKLREYCQNIK